MKAIRLLCAGMVIALAACDRSGQQTEAQKLAEDRAALERERAQLVEEKAAAEHAANDQERARLEAERATLDAEKARMAGNREATEAAEHAAMLASEREKRMAAERHAAEEVAARREAEIHVREEREAAAAAADQSRAAQTVDFFYDALDPYGDWVETDRYGYAFHPGAARDRHWRPYTDGGWVYTEYGWTWRSNEPFGWATYHYGRWAQVPRLGWVWVPSTEWGPAWVSWRRSDEYVGWAPLPPDAWSRNGFTAAVDSYFDIGPGLYTFLRVGDFGEPTYVGRVVEPERNVTIINQTVNVTNVTYQKVENNIQVVNRGPDITVINQHSRRRVPQLNVQRVSAASVGGEKPAQIRGNVLEVVAPNLKAPASSKKPKKVSATVKAADIERGWTGGQAETAKFRAAAKQEAKRAEEEQVAAKPAATRAPVASPAPAPAAKVQAFTPKPAAAASPASTPQRPATPAAERMQTKPFKRGRTTPAQPEALPTPTATPAPSATPAVEATPMPTPRLGRGALAPSATPRGSRLQPSRPIIPGHPTPPLPPPAGQPVEPGPAALPTPAAPAATPQAPGTRRAPLKQFRERLAGTPTPAPQATEGTEQPRRRRESR